MTATCVLEASNTSRELRQEGLAVSIKGALQAAFTVALNRLKPTLASVGSDVGEMLSSLADDLKTIPEAEESAVAYRLKQLGIADASQVTVGLNTIVPDGT
jgi:hypothetical protein